MEVLMRVSCFLSFKILQKKSYDLKGKNGCEKVNSITKVFNFITKGNSKTKVTLGGRWKRFAIKMINP